MWIQDLIPQYRDRMNQNRLSQNRKSSYMVWIRRSRAVRMFKVEHQMRTVPLLVRRQMKTS